MPRDLAGQRHPCGAHDRGQVSPRFFKLFVYYNIIEFRCVADFLARVPQPALNSFFRVLPPAPQAPLEFRHDRRRRENEDAHGVGEGLADLVRALPVDLEQDVQSLGARVLQPLLRRAVTVPVDLGRFEEIAALEHRLEGFAIDEVIFAAVDFPGAWRPRRVGDRQDEPLVIGERSLDQGRLARSRWGRNDEKASDHSMFWICSRICSISSLNSRLASESSRDTDFEPRVLASRFSSCIRKSRRLPTAPPAATTRDTSSRCAASRVSSSATSAFTPNRAISWRTRSSFASPSASRRRMERRSWYAAIASGSFGWIEASRVFMRSVCSMSIFASLPPSRERVAEKSSRSSCIRVTQASRNTLDRSSASTPGQPSTSPTLKGRASGTAARTL